MNNNGMDISSAINGLKFRNKNNLPMIHQTEIAECGLACLAMIWKFITENPC